VVANLALLGGSLVVALGATELVLRLAPRLLSEEARLRLSWQEQKLSHAARTRPDSAIGFLYVPGGRDEVRQGDVRFSYTTDRDGFRNADAPPDQAQIVAVGDSWTFGFGVDDSVAWPRLLADSLRPVRVRNLGLIGSGPEQYTRILERFGLPLHPSVILYGVFPGNDLDDQEAFEQWERMGRPGNFAEWRTYGPAGRRPPLWQRSYLAVALEEGWKYRHERFAGSTIRLPDGSPLQLAPARLLPKAERSHRGDPAFDGVLAAVDRARALATGVGARLVVLVFPTKEEVYLPLQGQAAPPLTSRWVPALRELGVDCLDLTDTLRAHARGAPLYFEVDGHVNAVGNRVIAQALQGYLRAHRAELAPIGTR
jgi:acetyltransferase AlgX (SGNH hydrolase-like protein)